MESSKEPIRLGLVSRTITLGLACLATSIIFTSVAVAFTAGAAGTRSADGRSTPAWVSTPPGV